ncbi:hypothetical protein NS365_05050 [Aureimonas ureilytica]|uniref:Uncharacterized protein n=1 Tax=Aureimonas ureilytica TaxID=401562 RepID=A0A175RUB2_9HYPH|nr:hypothetical protein [Aureimonas ureilytica]KTR07023.1 hypothetical protein NS365_05050 [Aureimonas ureilytica]
MPASADGNPDDLAQELADAYDNAEKDMVSLKDLEAFNARSDARIETITARSDARIKAAFHRQRIWIAGIAFLFTIAIVAIVKL